MCEVGFLAHCSCGYRGWAKYIIKMSFSFGNLNKSISIAPPCGLKILPAKIRFYLRWGSLMPAISLLPSHAGTEHIPGG